MQRQVAWQVHAVMQDAKDVDLVLGAVGPKNHHMPTRSALSGYVQGVNLRANLAMQFTTDCFWASTQVFQRQDDGLRISDCLNRTEMIRRPTLDCFEIHIGRNRISD